ncbi:hypothetical protein FUA23_15510 [Neolewinella aurantiaca]|uniref:Glycosyltransferase RgtA/B/C/D-like domain-containing protein n=1 Tax=Neolewinella aurantiaca TaxID=2602767 RepID=A0A5C7FF77_9BACT|nr:glycosyltransferase family 39 protein [Neolewinella aurantiaca]TXF88217.1 hypothetical protein FUA23_15510 [Neolewinella aurantiaca]
MLRGVSLSSWWLVFVLVLFLIGLGAFPVYIVDEARNAQAGWEMFRSGDWLVPTFNGGVRTDKPPLHYWAMQPFYALLGKTAVAARLGSALCGVLTALLVFAFCRWSFSSRAAILSASVYGLGIYVPLQFGLATPDPYLALCFTAGMFALFRGYRDCDKKFLFAGYALLGIGSLAKGPVIFVLAATAWAVYLLFSGRDWWSGVRRLNPLAGIILALAIAAPWYLMIHWQTEGLFTRDFFMDHNIRRFAHTKEGHGGPAPLILLLALGALLPFSCWLPRAAVAAAGRSAAPALKFCLVTGSAVLVFFALSGTKLPSYPFPALAFLAVLIGVWLERLWLGQRPVLSDHLAFSVASFFVAALPLAMWLGLKQDKVLAPLAGDWWHLGFLWPAALGAAWYWLRQRPTYALATLAAAWWGLHLYLMLVLLPAISGFNQVTASLPVLKPSPSVTAFGRFAPAYVFELDHEVPRLDSIIALTNWLDTVADGGRLLSAERYIDSIPPNAPLEIIFRQKDLFEYPTTIIYQYHAPH